MERLDIEYDFLPRESEILHLHFWDAAFTKLKEGGVLSSRRKARTRVAGSCGARGQAKPNQPQRTRRTRKRSKSELMTTSPRKTRKLSCARTAPWLRRQGYRLPHVEVRVAGRDFGYRNSFSIPTNTSADFGAEGEKDHPIRRCSRDLQRHRRPQSERKTPSSKLCGLGHNDEADHYTHFSYEMVALTPRCAAELGYELSEEDKANPILKFRAAKVLV